MPLTPSSGAWPPQAWTAWAICYVSSLAVVMLNLAPELEQQLRAELFYRPEQVGTFFFVELGALGAASIPFTRALGRLGGVRLAGLAALVWVAGNGLSILVLPSLAATLLCRFAAGLGAGTLMVLGMRSAAAARKPDTMFAWMVCCQLASGAALLAVLPSLMAIGGGLRAVFALNMLLAVPLLWFARSLGTAQPLPVHPAPGAIADRWNLGQGSVLLVMAVAMFNVAIGGLWTFVAEFGRPAAISSTGLAFVLSMATLAGIVGTVLAGSLGHRGSRTSWLLCGIACIVLGTFVLHQADHEAAFMWGCLMVSLGWNFSVPCLLSLCADRGEGARLMPAVNLAFAFGLAVGPKIAGWSFEQNGSDGLLALVLAALGAAAMLLAGNVFSLWPPPSRRRPRC